MESLCRARLSSLPQTARRDGRVSSLLYEYSPKIVPTMFSLSAIGQDCLKGHTDSNGMLGNAVPNRMIRKRLLTLEEIHINANTGNGVLVLHNSVRVDSFLREGVY